jgi:hypothetical protein
MSLPFRLLALLGILGTLAGCATSPEGSTQEDVKSFLRFTDYVARVRGRGMGASPEAQKAFIVGPGPYWNNRLRAPLSSKYVPWEIEYRNTLQSEGFVHYGIALRSKDGYQGSIGGILFPRSMPGEWMGARTIESKLQEKKPTEILARDSVKRIASPAPSAYALYRLSQRFCVIFATSTDTAALYGDVCAPAGQPLGKSRAEAIVTGIGFAGQFPAEGSELSTLPVD